MAEESNIPYKITRQINIKRSDVPETISQKAVALAHEAIDKFQIEKDMATFLKKKCDEQFGGTWHAIIGRNFGCSITHDTKYLMFFTVDLMNVLLFKSLE